MAIVYDFLLSKVRKKDVTPTTPSSPESIGGVIAGADAITTLGDTDLFPITVSSVLKKLTWANFKAAIKAFVDAFTYNKTVAVPAASFMVCNTNGAYYQQDENATNLRNRGVMVFAATPNKYIEFAIPNDGRFVTDKFKFKIRAKRYSTASATFVTRWGAQGLFTNPSDDIATLYGTAQTVDLTLTLDTKAYQSALSGTVTMGCADGQTISADSYISIRIYRDGESVTDDLADIAGLIDVTFEFNV
jgi:hypothetical protein